MAPLACGACTDALMESHFWWLTSAGPIVLALALEGLAFSAFCLARNVPPKAARHWVFAACGGLLVLALFSGAGMRLGLAAVSVVAALGLLVSVRANRALPSGVNAARVGLLAAGVVLGLWNAWPSHRSTEHLLDVGAYVMRFKKGDGWVFDELRARPEAIELLDSSLSTGDRDGLVELRALLMKSSVHGVAPSP